MRANRGTLVRRIGGAAVVLMAWHAVAGVAQRAARPAQHNDSAYTALIAADLSDSRISTDLVDHLPASATVPTPLKYLGHIIGAPGVLDHVAQIHGYLAAIAKASPRAKYWSIGKTDEGEEMVMLAIADSATIANLDRYRG